MNLRPFQYVVSVWLVLASGCAGTAPTRLAETERGIEAVPLVGETGPPAAEAAAPMRMLGVYTGTEMPHEFPAPGFDVVARYRRYIVAVRNSEMSGGDAISVFASDPSRANSAVSSDELASEIFTYDGKDPAFFAGVWRDRLFIDIGTGPDRRTVKVFDIPSGREVFHDDYIRSVSVARGKLQYWAPTSIPVTRANCRSCREWEHQGWDPVMTEQMVVDLRSVRRQRTGHFKCDFYN